MSAIIPVKAEEWVKMVEATKLAADLLVENKRLKDEVERLRKAGDALMHCVAGELNLRPYDAKVLRECYELWLDAKEGGAK